MVRVQGTVLPWRKYIQKWKGDFNHTISTQCHACVIRGLWVAVGTKMWDAHFRLVRDGKLSRCSVDKWFLKAEMYKNHLWIWLKHKLNIQMENIFTYLQCFGIIILGPDNLAVIFKEFFVQSLSCIQLFCDPMDCSLVGFSVHWISQSRIPVWVVISFSRESSRPRDWAHISCLAW